MLHVWVILLSVATSVRCASPTVEYHYIESPWPKEENHYIENPKLADENHYIENPKPKEENQYIENPRPRIKRQHFENPRPRVENDYIETRRPANVNDYIENPRRKVENDYIETQRPANVNDYIENPRPRVTRQHFENPRPRVENDYIDTQRPANVNDYIENPRRKVENDYIDTQRPANVNDYIDNPRRKVENDYIDTQRPANVNDYIDYPRRKVENDYIEPPRPAVENYHQDTLTKNQNSDSCLWEEPPENGETFRECGSKACHVVRGTYRRQGTVRITRCNRGYMLVGGESRDLCINGRWSSRGHECILSECRWFTDSVYSDESSFAVGGRNTCRTTQDQFPGQFTSVKRGELPYLGVIGDEDLHNRCYGALISERWFLSSAKCCETCNKKVRLDIFQQYYRNRWEAPLYDVIEEYIHPDYDGKEHHNLGLYMLRTAVQFSEFIRPACVPIKYQPPGTKGVFIGEIDENIVKTEVQVLTESQCEEATTDLEDESMFCVNKLSDVRGLRMYIGFPLVGPIGKSYCMYGLLGLGTFGARTKSKGNLRMSYYVPWIESVIYPQRRPRH